MGVGICQHCLNERECRRLPVMMLPSFAVREFDPNTKPDIHVLELCGRCEAEERERINASHSRHEFPYHVPGELLVGDVLDDDLII